MTAYFDGVGKIVLFIINLKEILKILTNTCITSTKIL